MVTRVKIQDIKAQWLNAQCLNVIAKYARLAYEVDETKIRMSSDTCLVDVVAHASQTHNPTLISIYKELKSELKVLLAADHLQPKLDALQKYEGQNNQASTNQPYSHYPN